MEVRADKIYKKSHLSKLLEFNGLGSSYLTILRYERIGLIPSPRIMDEGLKVRQRRYTGAQMLEIVDIVKEYESKKTKGKKIIYERKQPVA